MKFLYIVFWVLVLLGFDDAVTAAMTVTASIIHELGHEAAMIFLGKRPIFPRPVANGFKIRTGEHLSYREEIIICAAGPGINILAGLIALPFRALFGEAALLFSAVNLITALSNLLPVRNYDGYKILAALLAERECGYFAERLLFWLSFSIASAAVLLSLYIMYTLDTGYWIFGVFLIFLLKEVKNSLEE